MDVTAPSAGRKIGKRNRVFTGNGRPRAGPITWRKGRVEGLKRMTGTSAATVTVARRALEATFMMHEPVVKIRFIPRIVPKRIVAPRADGPFGKTIDILSSVVR